MVPLQASSSRFIGPQISLKTSESDARASNMNRVTSTLCKRIISWTDHDLRQHPEVELEPVKIRANISAFSCPYNPNSMPP